MSGRKEVCRSMVMSEFALSSGSSFPRLNGLNRQGYEALVDDDDDESQMNEVCFS